MAAEARDKSVPALNLFGARTAAHPPPHKLGQLRDGLTPQHAASPLEPILDPGGAGTHVPVAVTCHDPRGDHGGRWLAAIRSINHAHAWWHDDTKPVLEVANVASGPSGSAAWAVHRLEPTPAPAPAGIAQHHDGAGTALPDVPVSESDRSSLHLSLLRRRAPVLHTAATDAGLTGAKRGSGTLTVRPTR